jgi:diguanylate cyclase (GGDEF)-like protein
MSNDECLSRLDAHKPPLSAPTVSGDLVAMLDLLAETIVQALGFGVAAVNIACPDGGLRAVSVAGDDDARDTLLGTVEDAAVWDQLLAMSEPWGQLRFADHRSEAARVGNHSWTPDLEPIDAEDAWHPEDYLFAPLVASDGSRLGILSVDCPNNGRRPDSATCGALEAFAVSAALAIEHAALRQRAETSENLYRHLASHDQLTGVGNRSLLLHQLERAVTHSEEERSLLAVIFVDLDGFKTVNDTFSHEAGDQVLQAVAQRIEAIVRPHDTVARWGGDEFVILLERLASEQVALDIAQRITAALAQPLRDICPDLGVTASVGVSLGRPADHLSTDQLIREADAAMYGIKHSGRNAWAVFRNERDLIVAHH